MKRNDYLNSLAEQREDAYNDGLQKGIERGIEQGREEGREEGIMQIVRAMELNGMSREDISSATNLDMSLVNSLLDN